MNYLIYYALPLVHNCAHSDLSYFLYYPKNSNTMKKMCLENSLLRNNHIHTKPIASFKIGTHGFVLTGTNLAMVKFGTRGFVLTGTKVWRLDTYN